MTKQKLKTSFPEFVTLMALYVALMAMSIDMILPALSLMGQEFHIIDENQTQYVIGILFLGFTIGQIIYGPAADSFGRKPTIYVGLVIFAFGSILCLSAKSFEMILLGRFLQGFGAASPRIVSIAIIRDLYKGREMARVMSFIMTIFIIIPVIAPSIGQAILLVANWHIMFFVFLFSSIIAMIWTFFRLPETLKPEDIRPFKPSAIWQDFLKILNNKTTIIYAICAGLVFGAMIGYLTSSRQIFQDYFKVGELFPIYFGISALSIGISSILNSMIVRHYGMKLICHHTLIIMINIAALFLAISIFQHHQIALWQFMTFALITFFCLGMLFGNLNALAMEPMGHLAGTASAIIGCLSSGTSAIIGTIIGQAYNNTLTPMILGFLILTITAFLLQRSIEGEKISAP
jgi:MFS transporter, DHA1 family, multidrug resistance protein